MPIARIQKRVSLVSGLALVAVTALTGCNPFKLLEKKSSASAEATSTSESKKPDATDKTASSSSKDGATAATDKAAPPAEGPMWTEQITGEKKKMARVDITVAEVSGLSILAPEGAKIAASPGGRGAEIEDAAYGYLIWVHEDPTATLDLMKQGATAWNKDAKFVKETPTSIVVSQPSFDGSPAFYYKGIYKSGSKVIVCETPSSIAPTKQEHAEQIGKACDSLEAAGGVKLVADAGAPAAEPEASASAVAVNDPPPANAPVAVANNAPPPSKPPTNTTSAPPKTTSAGTPPATKTTTAPTSKPRRPALKKLH